MHSSQAVTSPNGMSRYPSDPKIVQKPAAVPRDGNKRLFATSSETEEGNNADINSAEPPSVSVTSDKHWVPGCPDHQQVLSDTFGVSSVNISQLSITCDQTQLSGLPYNVFHGTAGNVYDKFCFNLDSTIGQEWTVNAHGDRQPSNPKSIRREDSMINPRGLPLINGQPQKKRTPPPNPNSYDNYSFDLKWETNSQTLGCGQNVDSCRDVFAAIANSPCGHQASKSHRDLLREHSSETPSTGEQNIMAAAGKADVQGCGTYSYKINAPTPTPKPTPTPTGPDMSSEECKTCTSHLGASTCKASDNKCLLDQCAADTDCQKCKVDCSTFVRR